MRVLHVGCSDLSGGACRAAYRIHQCLHTYGSENAVVSRMRVIEKLSADPTVQGGDCKDQNPLSRYLRPRISLYHRFGIPFSSPNRVAHSFGWPDSGLGRELNEDSCDVIHLHWVGFSLGMNTLSIAEIGRLNKPVVWTLHDQWAFCGGEHYSSSPPVTDRRYIEGYVKENRPITEGGKDRNRLTWEAKRKHWTRPFTIVCPSTWLANCARESFLMKTWPIHVIPYPIDLDVWAPFDQQQARLLMRLPQRCPLVLFGATGGAADPRKGADLLLQALQLLREQQAGTHLEKVELVIFGQTAPAQPMDLGFPIHYAGILRDDVSLRLLYAAADVMVVPSRQEAFGQTASEAHACGTPVVAFRSGGLMDIVEDRLTGALAEPFDPGSLAAAIRWVLEDPERRQQMGRAARVKAVGAWDPERIAGNYADVYQQAVESQRSELRKFAQKN